MAKRPVFIAKDTYPFYTEKTIEFEYFAGFSESQKKKSINSLHNSYKEQGGGSVLEISNASNSPIRITLLRKSKRFFW